MNNLVLDINQRTQGHRLDIELEHVIHCIIHMKTETSMDIVYHVCNHNTQKARR